MPIDRYKVGVLLTLEALVSLSKCGKIAKIVRSYYYIMHVVLVILPCFANRILIFLIILPFRLMTC